MQVDVLFSAADLQCSMDLLYSAADMQCSRYTVQQINRVGDVEDKMHTSTLSTVHVSWGSRINLHTACMCQSAWIYVHLLYNRDLG